jgi:hypothetical protein
MENLTIKQIWANVALAIVIITVLAIIIIPNVVDKQDDSAFRNEFVYACATEANITFCDCTYEALKKDLGMDGLLEMAAEYNRTDVMPKSGYTAIAKCADKY